MEKSYIQRFQKFSDLLMDPELANHARKKIAIPLQEIGKCH